MEHEYDVVLVCQKENINPKELDEYHQNILTEQQLLIDAFKKLGLRATRVGWDSDFDWPTTRAALIRETWDYYHRIEEFRDWLNAVKEQTRLINDFETVRWNLDKFYLKDLFEQGVNIPKTIFIEKGDERTLNCLQKESGWDELIIKPAIAGAARDTYRIGANDISNYEPIYKELIQKESMLFQEFQPDVLENGERTLVMIGREYTHAVLKRAKKGDFRVQDDHGGTVHHYVPTEDEIEFAKYALSRINPIPAYGRVDVITDVSCNLALQELELIEPELWFRSHPDAAFKLAESIAASLV